MAPSPYSLHRWTAGARTVRLGRCDRAEAWLRVTFDSRYDVRHVRLEAGSARESYPRTITITGLTDDGQERELYRGLVLPLLAVGLVNEPISAPIDMSLPPNQTRALTIRGIDATHENGWAVDELGLYGYVAQQVERKSDHTAVSSQNMIRYVESAAQRP